MIDLKQFLTKESFAALIEKKVLEEGCTYFEAIIEFSENNDKTAEELLPYMTQVLLDKVKRSATEMGLINLGEPTLDELME